MALAIATTLSYCLLLFSCLLDGAVVLVRADASFSHTIPYGEEECMLIRVPTDQPHIISGSFDCLDIRARTDPIRVALYDNSEKMIWASRYGDSDGSFSVKGTGKHWLCLENGLTYEQNKVDHDDERTDPRWRVTRTLGFTLRVKRSVTAAAQDALGADGASNDVEGTTRMLLELTEDLNENFEVLSDHMSYMKSREATHRALHEKTFTRVVGWNILEICTVVVVTFGQVLNVWWIVSKRNSSYY